MGCCCETTKAGLCCFGDISPLALAISAIAINVFIFCFLIWEAADVIWGKKSAKSLFYVGFVFEIISFLGIIGLLILVLIRRNTSYYPTINNIGKISCIVIRIIKGLVAILIIISMIITLVEYGKLENEIKGYSVIPGRWWATAIIPPIVYVIGMTVLQVCLKSLYIIFRDNIYDSIYKHGGETENPVPVPGTSVLQTQVNPVPNVLITPVDPITKVVIDNKGAIPGYFIPAPGYNLDNLKISPEINKPINPENNLVNPANSVNNHFSPATPVNIASSTFEKNN